MICGSATVVAGVGKSSSSLECGETLLTSQMILILSSLTSSGKKRERSFETLDW